MVSLDRALEHFANIAPKTQQALRLFNEFYERRLNGYIVLGRRVHLKFWKNLEEEKRNALELLKFNNQRERKVFLEIYAGAYEEISPYLDMIEGRWKKEVGELKIMKGYFDNMFVEQKNFLDKESEFLDKKISKEDFKLITESYFKKVEEFSAAVVQKYAKFYSPIDFQRDLREKIKKGIIKESDMLGYIAVFVTLFVGVSNFNHSMPEKLIDIEKLPPAAIFIEFIFICYALMKLSAPDKLWAGMKKYSKSTVTAIASII